MHCSACGVELTDFEATRKYSDGGYIDLCNNCFSFISEDVNSDVRFDLMHESDTELYTDYIDSDADYIDALNLVIDNDDNYN